MAYCTREDIERIFGADNVAKWADLSNQQSASEISERIDHAIQIASEEVDSILVASIYRTPLADTVDDTPLLIREITATLAGVYLFESRGVMNVTLQQVPPGGQMVPVHAYTAKRQWAWQVLQELRTGIRRIKELI